MKRFLAGSFLDCCWRSSCYRSLDRMRRFQQLHCSFHLLPQLPLLPRSNPQATLLVVLQVRPRPFLWSTPGAFAATEFKNCIEEKSGGSMTVEIYPPAPPVPRRTLAGMLVGTTSMTMSGGSFNGYAPSATPCWSPPGLQL